MRNIVVMFGFLLFAATPWNVSRADWNESEVLVQVPPEFEIPGMTVLAIMPFSANIGTVASGAGDGAANKLIAMIKDEPNNFTVVDRQNLGLTQDEMKLAEAGIVDPETAARIGRARGAQGMGIGSLENFVCSQTRSETRDVTVLGKRIGTKTWYLKDASIQVDIKLIRTIDAEIVAIVTRSTSRHWETEKLSEIPADGAIALELINEAVHAFIAKISIHNVKMRIKLDDEAGKDQVETIAIYLNTRRTERALQKAMELVKASTGADLRKRAASLYNVGVVLEAMGKCEGAMDHYFQAMDLFIEGGKPKDVPDTYESASRRTQLCMNSQKKNQEG